MNGEDRRKRMLEYLKDSSEPVSGTRLSEEFHVSRQVVVQDIALLRASEAEIMSTYKGYVCQSTSRVSRVWKVRHDDTQIQEELYAIVDLGGTVEDVYIRHKMYGEIRADMKIRSRRQTDQYLEDIRTGKSSPLKNITSDYHYHTVTADSREILDQIEEKLKEKGFLVPEKNRLC